MMDSSKSVMERAHVFFSGRVQGVGFRFTCLQMATGFAVTGWVRNLTDGRVELVAEGERAEVETFLVSIDREMGDSIRDRTLEWLPATGQWGNFQIER